MNMQMKYLFFNYYKEFCMSYFVYKDYIKDTVIGRNITIYFVINHADYLSNTRT